MLKDAFAHPIRRRTILKAGFALGAVQFASPFVIKARAEEPIKFGLDDPFTGTYAELGKNEQIGCELAIEEINAKGGILGRQAMLVSEDSTSTDTGTAVQKAHKLIERDKVDFLLGNVNSAMALAIGEVSNQAKILHIVTGGHTDAVTGTDCHWNVFRVCNTTRMETNSVSKLLFDKFGKKWYFITPDYAFGHTLQQGFEASLKKFGGTEVGASLTPLGATDYSSFLIKAQAADPDVIIFLTAGQDAVNSLKQAVQFGLEKKFHIAGAQQELEVLEGLPPEAQHRHLGVRVVLEPTQRTARQGVRRRLSRSGPAARCRPRDTGSATHRYGPARSLPMRRRPSKPPSLPRRLRTSNCRRKSR